MARRMTAAERFLAQKAMEQAIREGADTPTMGMQHTTRGPKANTDLKACEIAARAAVAAEGK